MSISKKKHIVICHGGGPTAVINASLAGIIAEAKKHREIGKILVSEHGIEGFLNSQFIDMTGITDQQLTQLSITPSSAIGTCRYKVKKTDYPAIKKIFEQQGIGYFFYNGGNDSMDTCCKIAGLVDDTQVIGVPKTIDNDLAVTHHTPGFGSAARYAAITALELGLDLRALPIHVSVIEFMGRNAGWIAGSSALARKRDGDAPHLIYLPERPFKKEEFLEDVEDAYRTYGGVVVAVSEGLTGQDGKALVGPKYASDLDSFGHSIPGNNSQLLADMITRELGIRARSEKPGLPGRASYLLSSNRDRREAYESGSFAMRSALEGVSGMMSGYRVKEGKPYALEHIMIPLEDVANEERLVPLNWINERGNDVTSDFIDYVRPIINEDMPDYFRIDDFCDDGFRTNDFKSEAKEVPRVYPGESIVNDSKVDDSGADYSKVDDSGADYYLGNDSKGKRL